MGYAVNVHASKIKNERASSTGDGIDFLGLSHIPENYGAGNLYLAALEIINELKEKLDEAKGVCKKVIDVGIIFEDDKPEKPSVIYGFPSSPEWCDIFLSAKNIIVKRET